MIKLFLSALMAMALSGCAAFDVDRAALNDLVRGPARVCFAQTSFLLPANGTLVRAEQGRIAASTSGTIGPRSFEIAESRSFAPPGVEGEVVFENEAFIVRELSSFESLGVFRKVEGGMIDARPVVRLDHLFGTQSVTLEQFFADFRLDGASASDCTRRFIYG